MPDKPTATFYLTFDDGPHATGTPVLLKALKTCDARATFFLWAKSNGIGKDDQYKLVKSLIEDGHAIANHGDDHLPMTSGGPWHPHEGDRSVRDVRGGAKTP